MKTKLQNLVSFLPFIIVMSLVISAVIYFWLIYDSAIVNASLSCIQ